MGVNTTGTITVGNIDTDGSLNWITPAIPTEDIVAPIPQITNGFLSSLYACNIKTSITFQSIDIVQYDQILLHVELLGISSFELINDTVVLNTSDKVPFYLIFASPTEAVNGYGKIEDAINGAFIDCDDEVITSTLTLFDLTIEDYLAPDALPFPCLLFINSIPVKKFNTQIDVVGYLNSVSNGKYACSAGINQSSYVFTYQDFQSSYIPESMSVISSFFTCKTTQQDISFVMDMPDDTFLISYNNNTSLTKSTQFSFINPGPNTFDVFFTEDFAALLDFGSNNFSSITGTLPSQVNTFFISTNQLTDLGFLSQMEGMVNLKMENTPASNFPVLSSYDTLIAINLKNCGFTSLSGFDALPSLGTLIIDNLPLLTTPSLDASISLVYLSVTNCNFLTSIASLDPNISLGTFILSASILPAISTDFLSNINLKTLKINSTQAVNLPSLSNNRYLTSVDVSGNNFTEIAIESFVDDLANNGVVQCGILSIGNQQTIFDFTIFSSDFLQNIDTLKILRAWTVNF